MNTRRYAIIGTGAVGGHYGIRLRHAGLDVHYLLHADFDHVKRHGLQLKSVTGDIRLPRVNAYDDPRAMPRCDVVCVALKATHNALLGGILPHVLAEDGVVLLMQNGLGAEDELARIVGPGRVMGALCFICAAKTGPGTIEHIDYGYIELAEYTTDGTPGGITPRMRTIAADFEQAGIEVRLSEDLVLARWKKLAWNVPYNGLCVTLRADTAAIMADPYAAGLAEALMREVAAGAAAFGRVIDDGFIHEMLDSTRRMVPYSPSMKLDFEAGRPMEVEAIFGNPLRAAAKRGVRLPRMEMLCQELRSLDGLRGGGPALT